METAEADGELQLVTECWVEPQYGVITNSTPERRHFDGLEYSDLPKAVSTSYFYTEKPLRCEHLWNRAKLFSYRVVYMS